MRPRSLNAELCIHDLVRAQCALCAGPLPRRAVTPQEFMTDGPAYGRWITAAYDGECGGAFDCSGLILPGDRIRADGAGGWLCEICGDENADLAYPEPRGEQAQQDLRY
jgi:hypothetical protein